MAGSQLSSELPPLDALLKRLREEKPLVQCITNFVSMDIMANTLLAIGASPAMVGIIKCSKTSQGTVASRKSAQKRW